MRQIYLKHFSAISFFSILFIFFVVYVTGPELLGIKVFISFLTIVVFLDSLYFAFYGRFFNDRTKLSNFSIRPILLLVLLLFIIYSPLIIRNAFFHDDYINFKGEWGSHFFEFTFSQGRQVTGILTDLMNYVTIDTSWHLHLIAVLGLIIYILILFQTIYTITSSLNKAIYISLMMSLITPVINVLSYGSMFCYSLAFCFSAMGILHFKKSLISSKKDMIFHFLIGVACIIVANFVYQATATAAFSTILLCYLIDYKTENSKLFPFKASIFFAFSTGIYYILVKFFLLFINNNALMIRASTISSLSDILNKAVWFKSVLLEAIKQLSSTIVGSEAFVDPWMHYLLFYRKPHLEIFTITICLVLIIFGFIQIWKRHRILGVIQTASMVVLSYYVFLILKESSYTSYYAVALCSCLLLIMLSGLDYIYDSINHLYKNINTKSLILLKNISIYFACFIMCLNGNYYIRDFWINYNFSKYSILKQQIIDKYNGESRIHVVGTLYPGEADIYASSAARLACKEIGVDINNINFTSSSNSDYIEALTLDIYEQLVLNSPPSDVEFLKSIYLTDPAFAICYLQTNLMSEDDYQRLTSIFSKTGIIPKSDTPNVLIISLL